MLTAQQVAGEIFGRMHNAMQNSVRITRNDLRIAGMRQRIKETFVKEWLMSVKQLGGRYTQISSDVWIIHAPSENFPSYSQVADASIQAEQEGWRSTTQTYDDFVIPVDGNSEND